MFKLQEDLGIREYQLSLVQSTNSREIEQQEGREVSERERAE